MYEITFTSCGVPCAAWHLPAADGPFAGEPGPPAADRRHRAGGRGLGLARPPRPPRPLPGSRREGQGRPAPRRGHQRPPDVPHPCAPLAPRGFETVALDNLGYGLTQVKPGTIPSYDDWVDLVADFLAFERSRDDRPIVLYGLSAGGMLTYHVAAKAPRGTLRGIVGMTFLDQRKQVVRDQTAHDIITARAGAPLMHLAAKTPPDSGQADLLTRR